MGMSGMIPIRSMQTPPRSSAPAPQTPLGRLASSAPASSFGALGMGVAGVPVPTPPGAMSRMTAGGFKPKVHTSNNNTGHLDRQNHAGAGTRTGGFAPLMSMSTAAPPSSAFASASGPGQGRGQGQGARPSGIGAGLARLAAGQSGVRRSSASASSTNPIAVRADLQRGQGGQGQGGGNEDEVGSSRVRKDRPLRPPPGRAIRGGGGLSGAAAGWGGAGVVGGLVGGQGDGQGEGAGKRVRV